MIFLSVPPFFSDFVQVLPESKISFELSAVTPLFAYGFGDSTLPELCVRVVRGIPEEEMEQRQHVTEGRRQSTLVRNEFQLRVVRHINLMWCPNFGTPCRQTVMDVLVVPLTAMVMEVRRGRSASVMLDYPASERGGLSLRFLLS